MIQVTVISATGTRYPIAWFAKDQATAAYAFADEMQKRWASAIVHEIQSAVMNGVLVDRTHWTIN